MRAVCYDWLFKILFTYWTLLWNKSRIIFILQFFFFRVTVIQFTSILRFFFLLFFPIFFDFPTRLIITPVMHVETTISKYTNSGIMVIFAPGLIIIKSACLSYINVILFRTIIILKLLNTHICLQYFLFR